MSILWAGALTVLFVTWGQNSAWLSKGFHECFLDEESAIWKLEKANPQQSGQQLLGETEPKQAGYLWAGREHDLLPWKKMNTRFHIEAPRNSFLAECLFGAVAGEVVTAPGGHHRGCGVHRFVPWAWHRVWHCICSKCLLNKWWAIGGFSLDKSWAEVWGCCRHQ